MYLLAQRQTSDEPENTHVEEISYVLPPQETSTVGKSSQLKPYAPSPSDSEPDALLKAFFTALVGPYMSVVPLSTMVSKPDATVLPLMIKLAPLICQKPDSEETSWNSRSPLYLERSEPPR